jgi:hypothetical protein
MLVLQLPKTNGPLGYLFVELFYYAKMTLKSLLLFILIGLLGYWAYTVVSTHTSPEVVAYKSFASALQRGNSLSARQYVAAGENQPMEALQHFSARQSQLFNNDGDPVFTYHRILRRTRSQDNRIASLRIEQVIRFNTSENQRFYGSESVSVIHAVEMVKEAGGWKVYRFYDPFM